eukprot:2213137-Pyramimonas_sp.AAC.1
MHLHSKALGVTTCSRSVKLAMDSSQQGAVSVQGHAEFTGWTRGHTGWIHGHAGWIHGHTGWVHDRGSSVNSTRATRRKYLTELTRVLDEKVRYLVHGRTLSLLLASLGRERDPTLCTRALSWAASRPADSGSHRSDPPSRSLTQQHHYNNIISAMGRRRNLKVS